jgi:transposase
MIETILPGVAAIDLGAERLFVGLAQQPVRSFGTCTRDLRELAAWLQQNQVQRVAMEATGVLWIRPHDYLQGEGFEVTLFHGAHARNLPGRKTDVQDCQWHGMLHSHGLLVACFIPSEEIRQLRCYYRLREDHLSIAAEHIQHLQRALDLMNVRLHVVISQIHGVSGLRVIRAILAGQRDPVVLGELCDAQILKKKRAEVIKSLQGHWQEHHLFALRQALESYEFCRRQMAACDQEIEALLQKVTKEKPPQSPEPGAKVKVVRHNAPQIDDLHRLLITLTGGRDATQLPGISPLGFMKLIGETGTDLSKWKTAKHFTSWLGLAPGNSQSGKRRKRLARKKTVAGQLFREAVLSIAKSKHLALGAAYRRLRAKKGSPIAIPAIARKLAVLYYNLFTKGLDYVEEGVKRYEEKYRQQTLRYLEKTAKAFGFALTPTTA